MHQLSVWVLVLARRLLMLAVARLLGAQQAAWAQAMQAEAANVGSECKGLAFAWGCLCAALGHRFSVACGRLARFHNAYLLSFAGAVLTGCVFMHNVGAPSHYVWMNLLSLVIAVGAFGLMPRRRLHADELLRAKLAFALGALLLVGSLVQAPPQASPWLQIGPVALNLPWLTLPALLLASEVQPQSAARSWALGGLLMACGTLTLLADPLLLGLVAAVLVVRAWHRKDIALALLALVSSAMAAYAWQSWQAPQAVAFVDQVVHRGFEQNVATGLGLALMQLLPLWPALRDRQARQHSLVWGLLVILSLPGWLPSPLVGFGGSFIVGYTLSLVVLGRDITGRPAADPWSAATQVARAHRPSPAQG